MSHHFAISHHFALPFSCSLEQPPPPWVVPDLLHPLEENMLYIEKYSPDQGRQRHHNFCSDLIHDEILLQATKQVFWQELCEGACGRMYRVKHDH